MIDGGETEAGVHLCAPFCSSTDGDRNGYLVGELASELIGDAFPEAGLQGFEVLVGRLSQFVEAEGHDGEDHSYIWRPMLDTDRGRDARDQMVSAVRDAGRELIAADTSLLPEVLGVLDARRFSIFNASPSTYSLGIRAPSWPNRAS